MDNTFQRSTKDKLLILSRSIQLLELLSDYCLPVEDIIDWEIESYQKDGLDFVDQYIDKGLIFFDTFIDGTHKFELLEFYFNELANKGIISQDDCKECLNELKELFPIQDLFILERMYSNEKL